MTPLLAARHRLETRGRVIGNYGPDSVPETDGSTAQVNGDKEEVGEDRGITIIIIIIIIIVITIIIIRWGRTGASLASMRTGTPPRAAPLDLSPSWIRNCAHSQYTGKVCLPQIVDGIFFTMVYLLVPK